MAEPNSSRLADVLKVHPAPWRTGSRDQWLRDVRNSRGIGVAWCGGAHGVEAAAAIVEAVNEAAASQRPDDTIASLVRRAEEAEGRIASALAVDSEDPMHTCDEMRTALLGTEKP